MIKFEKVSLQQYIKDCRELGRTLSNQQFEEEWNNIKLPTRATTGSAGYDFYAPYSLSIESPEDSTSSLLSAFAPSRNQLTTTIATGIRFVTDQEVVLICAPRSGQGFKYGLRLQNTIGVIDADYANSDNEGHIKAKLFAEIKSFRVEQGQGFMQGLILPYYVVDGDSTSGIRNGGFGSTDRG